MCFVQLQILAIDRFPRAIALKRKEESKHFIGAQQMSNLLFHEHTLTCGIQWACCAGESGRVWLFDRDFQIFFENTCPTFVDDFDFCMLNVVLSLLTFASPASFRFAELLLPAN